MSIGCAVTLQSKFDVCGAMQRNILLNYFLCCSAEVVQKEGSKLASRQEFAKRVALDLFR